MAAPLPPLPGPWAAWLDALLTGPLRFSGEEWRLLLALATGRACRPAALARLLERDPDNVARVARRLRRSRVVTRLPGGDLAVQLDPTRWLGAGSGSGGPAAAPPDNASARGRGS